MSITKVTFKEFLKRAEATEEERIELSWYLAYLRWRKMVSEIISD